MAGVRRLNFTTESSFHHLELGVAMWVDRSFTDLDAERVDDLGFLDPVRSPRLRPARDLLAGPAAWVLGRPWIGKSTVAGGLANHLRLRPDDLLLGAGHRVCLTRLGLPNADGGGFPSWWNEWVRNPVPAPAVWLIDGVDEALDSHLDRLDRIAEQLDAAPDAHLRQLRLVLFSRPYSELGDLRTRLRERYESLNGWGDVPQFWLTRLDRAAAGALVGPERFAAVEGLIRRHNLQPVAGYPVVLRFLREYHAAADRLTQADVWRGVLTALLGERQSNRAVAFATTPAERFAAACRIAAVLALTRRKTVREYSPDRGLPTVGTLFHPPDGRNHLAAAEVCRSALFTSAGPPGEFRFTQRNAQDWLAAFALAELPAAALRSALAAEDGTLALRLREVARLLPTVRPDPPTRAVIDRLTGGQLLPSDAVEPTLAESLAALDRLEALAAGSPWGLRLGYDGEAGLARLRADGLGVELTARLRDPARPPRVKHLLIDVAEATRAAEAADAAVELTLDPAQEDGLRYDAVWMVTRLGGEGHLAALERPVGESGSETEIECRLRGVVVHHFLRHGRWSCARAALHAPPVSPRLVDSRQLLLRLLEERITLADARQLLPHLRELWDRHAEEHHPFDLPDFLARAVSLVLGETPPDSADVDTLVRFVHETVGDGRDWLRAREITQRLRAFPPARRRLYLLDLTADERERALALTLLGPEDWTWVRDQALGPLANRTQVWEHAYWTAWAARQADRIPDADWEAFTRLVDEHSPGLRVSFDDARQRYERQQAEAERRLREAEENNPRRRPLRERVGELLARVDLPAEEVVRGLGRLCFSPEPWSRNPAGGEWGDLQPELQRRVLAACRRGLAATQPTPIPVAGSFPAGILYEGGAFAAVVTADDAGGWLTPELIVRWLPTALFSRMSDDWAGPIAACAEVSPPATEAALLATLDLHASQGGGAFVLRQIPVGHWTEALSDRLVTLVGNEGVVPGTRRELLDHLATRDPDRAEPIAVAWAARPLAADADDLLRIGGRNLLVVRRPDTVLDLAEAELDARGPAVLEELPSLYEDRSHPMADPLGWPLPRLERLARLLLRAYPTPADPHFEGGLVTPDLELRGLRDRIVSTLLGRPDPEAAGVVDRLAALDPGVKERVDTHRANAWASALLPSLGPAADPDALTVAEAVQLLDRAGYRLVRSADDLLDAVLEALDAIERSVGLDLPMLYSAPLPNASRTRLHEDALQAYLRRRLLGELARVCDGVEVQILREDQVGYRERLDLRVTAPRHGGGGLATVVVEVKWSTNDETRSGLVDQLGERYLRREGLTHGVFLVGWSGGWRPGDGTGENTDRDALFAYLLAQRDAFCGPGGRGVDLKVSPVVLDLRWSRTAG